MFSSEACSLEGWPVAMPVGYRPARPHDRSHEVLARTVVCAIAVRCLAGDRRRLLSVRLLPGSMTRGSLPGLDRCQNGL